MKLVRDNIPSRHPQHSYRRAEEVELPHLLLLKLMEEAGEVVSARNDGEMLEELGDLLEVVLTIAYRLGIGFPEIDKSRMSKRARLGGFSQGFIMTDYRED
jgi:predicted house-cleaning noncanonical NTP pyrophosphatase (MazG superfamily)